MKDILLVTNYAQFPGETGNSRYTYLASILSERGFNVEIVASTFYHKTKKQRNFKGSDIKGVNYKTTLIYEPGYIKNVSIKRLHSNEVIAKNIIKYLKNRKKPDLIYCPFPPISIGKKVSKFAKNHNIPFVIDIQDLWPEAFKMVFNVPVISDILFYPMKQSANKVFQRADSIIAVSNTYVNRALDVNKTLNAGTSVFLGTDLKKFDAIVKNSNMYTKQKVKNDIWLAYIGTLGTSYDIKLVIDALKELRKKNINNIKFVIMGDGPKMKEFQNYALQQEVNCEFTGMLPYDEMVQLLSMCDIAVNPIVQGGASSIINKVGDYAAMGLPVLNTQDSAEYRAYVNEYEIGFNCEPNSFIDLANKLEILATDYGIRKRMGNNNRNFAELYFDREITYNKIVDVIENLVEQ